ncbi:porin [Trinickia terrae]|uniref:Porin n=1 Tax=Trinickia terrae TaxID=2571161 RepID=A0A4U1HGY0_9BURK|nr:porin [Trinickia terrae]TKC79233.1 porin [Trinickia terrae]
MEEEKVKRSALTVFAIAAATLGAIPGAHAQSSVTLWGLLDAGVSYVSNESGHAAWKLDDGIAFPDLLGFKGSEDLGNGTHAIFQLISQFTLQGNIVANATNGSGTGTGFFARNAWLGLENDRYGQLTLGRQYDFMVDTLFRDVGADMAMYGGGFYAFRDGPFGKLGVPGSPPDEAYDFDRMNGDTPLNNAMKYTSPLIGGFRLGGMYAFGGTAGDFRQNSAYSFGTSYSFGPYAFGAAYTDVRYASLLGDSIRNFGLGARYHGDKLLLTALFTNTRNTMNGAAVNAAEAGALYQFTPAVSASLAYTYMWGNAAVDSNHAHQLTAVARYTLSKRTSVYLESVYQLTNAGANAVINGTFDASSGRSQLIGRIGMQTMF